MDLSTTLLKKFAQVTNDENASSTSKIAYGTVKSVGDTIRVVLDGSDYETAVVSTLDVEEDDRVIVTIEDHTATITSNITSPSSGRNATSVTETLVEYIHYADDYFNELSIGLANIDEAYITNLIATSATIQDLIAETAKIDDAYIINLVATSAEIQDLIAETAQIDDAYIINLVAESGVFDTIYAKQAYIEVLDAEIVRVSEELYATNSELGTLTAEVGNITDLLAGTASVGELQSIHLSSSTVVADDAFITDEMVINLSADKITAGTIYTSEVTIQTAENDDSLYMSNSLIQMSDENHVRVQIGKDNLGLFNYYLWDENGNLQWDALGVTENGINDEVIVDRHVAEGANIQGSKLDIDSLERSLNENGYTISGAQVTIDNNTLDYELSSITEKLTGLEGVTFDGMEGFVEYFALSVSDTEPPDTTFVNDIVAAFTDVAETDVSYTDVYDEDATIWTLEQPMQQEDLYLWKCFKCTYIDGHTEWTDPILLTDSFLRSTTSTIQTKLTVVEGEITAGVWKTDIENSISDMWSTLNITLDGLTTQVGNLQSDGETMAGQISTINQTIENLTFTVENFDETHYTKGEIEIYVNDAIGEINSTLENDYSKTSSIQQYIDESMSSISLTVSDGKIGDTASITMTAGNNTEEAYIDLTEVRKAFEEDESSITISAGSIRFASGTLLISTSQFELDEDGNATFSGKIYASEGEIGGFNISSSSIYTNSNSYASMSGNIYIGSSGISLGTAFSVSSSGSLTATSGKIGGFNISSSSIYTNSNSYASTSGNIYIGSSGISLGTTFKVSSSGALTSTSGTIGGYTIGSSSLKSSTGNVAFYSDYIVVGKSRLDIDGSNKSMFCGKSTTASSTGESLRICTHGGFDEPANSNTGVFFSCGADSSGRYVRSYTIAKRTSGTTANVRVASGGVLTAISSSSARYKRNITALTNPDNVSQKNVKIYDLLNDSSIKTLSNNSDVLVYEESALSLLKIPVSVFNYNEGYMSGEHDFDYDKPILGFIAEDVEQVCPECVEYCEEPVYEIDNNGEYVLDEFGNKVEAYTQKTDEVETWSSWSMIPRIVYILQYQQKLIEDQAVEIEQLKAQIA